MRAYKCNMRLGAGDKDRLKGRQVLCEITGSLLSVWLWISPLFHFSLASPLSTSICNALIFPAHSSTTFSLSAHLLALLAQRVCVKGMIFWCPQCVRVLSLYFQWLAIVFAAVTPLSHSLHQKPGLCRGLNEYWFSLQCWIVLGGGKRKKKCNEQNGPDGGTRWEDGD